MGRRIPKRLVIDIGLVAMGITLILLAIVKPVAIAFGAAAQPLEEAIPAIAPLVSRHRGRGRHRRLRRRRVLIRGDPGPDGPAGGSPGRCARADLRHPQHAAVGRLVPAGLLAPAIADILNIFFEGAGIPAVMAVLGMLTLWAGIALVAPQCPRAGCTSTIAG